MAYTPINWQTGDTITAEKLNKCDNGWSVETSSTTCFDGSVTTEADGNDYYADLTMASPLSTTIGNEATITFNGTPYNCTCFDDEGIPTYGGVFGDFTEYPFNLSYVNGWGIFTETAGTYTLKIETASETVEVSSDFVKVRGWGEINTTLFNETLTTTSGNMGNSATMAYTGDPTAIAEMNITFDGTEYACQQQSGDGMYWYGAPSPSDFSTYPFVCLAMDGAWYLVTETAGEYTVVGAVGTLNTSSGFVEAVNSCLDSSLPPFRCVSGTTSVADASAAKTAGRILYFTTSSYGFFFLITLDLSCTFFPENANVTAKFNRDTGIFTVTES